VGLSARQRLPPSSLPRIARSHPIA
jgi:hypothetical protein